MKQCALFGIMSQHKVAYVLSYRTLCHDMSYVMTIAEPYYIVVLLVPQNGMNTV